ncbi:MAG TPA: M48 family metalloprotease, partial [Bdellovibrionota bacterium]|nr:M48 family metalloprotease [Bdellovibrionota bacterium]
KVYEIPTDSPNAFATGRNPQHAAVAVTRGIRSILSEQELEGVIAHELAHVQNRDTLISCIAASIAGAIMMLAHVARWGAIFGSRDNRNSSGLELIVLSIIAPLAALVVQMAISRSREYLADATGAQIACSPSGLASALRKLDAVSRRIPLGNSPATAHLFIVNPFSGKNILQIFSTHPPVEERIKRLLTLQPMMAVGLQIA